MKILLLLIFACLSGIAFAVTVSTKDGKYFLECNNPKHVTINGADIIQCDNTTRFMTMAQVVNAENSNPTIAMNEELSATKISQALWDKAHASTNGT